MVSAPKRVVEVEPVREFMGDHHALARSLLLHLEADRAERGELLARNPAGTFDEYRHRCGVIEGLDRAIAICKDIQSRM